MINSVITEVAIDLIAKGGGKISPELVEYLNRDFDPSNRNAAVDEERCEAVFKGFLFHAANGHAFSDMQNVYSFFNMSFDEAYPEATTPFIQFAISYWTLKFIVMPPPTAKIEQRPERPRRTEAWELLWFVESNITGLFFPTPGHSKINPQLREREQRRILQEAGVPVDIEEFIRNNPILIRDRKRLKSARIGKLVGLVIFICIGIIFFQPLPSFLKSIITVFFKIIGILFIIYSISSFIQSFRKEESVALLQLDDIIEDPNITSRKLRVISSISLIIGIILISI